MLERWANREPVLILAPTVELVHQVAVEVYRVRPKFLQVLALTGGDAAHLRAQRELLRRGAHVVVSTPQFAAERLAAQDLLVANLRALVLDEADAMLERSAVEELLASARAAPIDARRRRAGWGKRASPCAALRSSRR